MIVARLVALVSVLLATLPGTAMLARSSAIPGAGMPCLPRHGAPARPPFYFEMNRGQAGSQVRFLARAPGSTLFLTARQAILILAASRGEPAPPAVLRNGSLPTRHPVESALRLEPVGISHPSIIGLDPLPGRVNYLLGNDPHRWHTDIPTFARVEYRNVYPGIDLVYRSHSGVDGQSHLEYDWIVSPTAQESAIRMRVLGQNRLRLDRHGGLQIQTGSVSIVESKPVIYQSFQGKKSLVPGHYILTGRDTIGFVLGRHNPHLPVTIDPTLLYSTYLGGSAPDAAESIATDSQGNTYVTGYTESNDFPLARPAQDTLSSDPSCADPQHNRTNCDDVFVTKLSADGGTMLYSTYLGGTLDDEGRAVAVDAAGDAYITGHTLSPNFPTVNALQSHNAGGSDAGDAFVAALKPAGDGLVYSTYLGGRADEAGEAIAASNGAAYVTGETDSPDFPVLHAFQPSYRGGAACGTADAPETCANAFIAKLATTGSLAYSSYLGGSRADEGLGIAVMNGDAYVAGSASSPDFPTAHALQPALAAPGCSADRSASNCSDGFITRVSSTGNTLVYSTYLGGTGVDIAHAVAVDAAGDAYVVGDTYSSDFPMAHALKSSFGEQNDSAFVSKLNASGSSLAFSTYLGGSLSDEADAVAVDAAGNVYVAGTTLSLDFPVSNPIQRSLATPSGDVPPQNGFIAELDTTGTSLPFSTYFGGGDHDLVAAIALDSVGSLHVAGLATSEDLPTAHPLQPEHGGGTFDGWVAEISNPNPPAPVPTPTLTPLTTGTPSPSPTHVMTTKSCPKGSRLIHGRCVKSPRCKKGYRLVHGKCRKAKN